MLQGFHLVLTEANVHLALLLSRSCLSSITQIFETEHAIAILDAFPLTRGHAVSQDEKISLDSLSHSC